MELNKEEKSKLFSIFENIKGDLNKESSSLSTNRTLNSNVLLVDGTNTFFRCWSANPMMNDHGMHVGGVAGFLKSVGYAIKLVNPTRCVIVFDGAGGSLKRKKLFPEYKEHKHVKIRLNRIYEEDSVLEEEEKNLKKQMFRTVEYLMHLPVNQLMINQIEADDTIAYCAVQCFKEKVVIMSSDKDFLQLVDNRISVWSPTKKRLYGIPEVLADYGIHPFNFVLFRAMDGDASDNIPGIEGAGPKTIIKRFPFLSENKEHTIKDILDYSKEHVGEYKLYDRVIEQESVLERNYYLMQLKETQISTVAQLHINDCLNSENRPKLDRYNFVKLITEDRMWNNIPNYGNWLTEVFGGLDSLIKG
jgi:5'-3' exonuclease